mmetsp:Transcript_35162/g.63276  ORF Transcript_35162/g.63276 Transcript_35162/m.63276 type:complete len:83 (-) Transcript_35162:147-395(-)
MQPDRDRINRGDPATDSNTLRCAPRRFSIITRATPPELSVKEPIRPQFKAAHPPFATKPVKLFQVTLVKENRRERGNESCIK